MTKIEIIKNAPADIDLTFKIVLIGDSAVGKTQLCLKATKNKFEDFYSPTIGFEFITLFLKIDDKNIKINIWDTCGQEVYKSLIDSFYRDSSLIILAYSIDNQNSYLNLDVWLQDVKKMCNENIKLALVGTKSDYKEKRQVSNEDGLKFKNENNFDLFMETSSKNGNNVDNFFIEIGKILYNDYIKNVKEGRKISLDSIKTNSNDEKSEGERKEENKKEVKEKEKEIDLKNQKIESKEEKEECIFDKHLKKYSEYIMDEYKQNNNELNYCEDCKVFTCNKCQKIHFKLCEKHHLYILDDEDEFEDKDSDINSVKENEDGDKDILENNIKKLDKLLNKFKTIINENKSLNERMNEKKEFLKLRIKTMFKDIKNILSEKENLILLELDNKYYYNEELINNREKFYNKIKTNMEEGNLIDKLWDEKDKIGSFTNCYHIIYKMIQEIKNMNENIIEKLNLNLRDKKINKFVKIVNDFGDIFSEDNQIDEIYM